jgi:hypothetical protein
MLDSLVRVSRRAGWVALCYRRGREQATAREINAPTTPVGPRRNESATTTRDRTLARSTGARSTEVNSAGLFRIQDRRAVRPRTPGLRDPPRRVTGSHPGFRRTPNGSRRATRGEVRNPTGAQAPTEDPPRHRTSRSARVYPSAAGGQWTEH